MAQAAKEHASYAAAQGTRFYLRIIDSVVFLCGYYRVAVNQPYAVDF